VGFFSGLYTYTKPHTYRLRYILVKEVVVFKEFKYLKRTGRSYRPIGPPLKTDIVN
jgi:hypothetical protein